VGAHARHIRDEPLPEIVDTGAMHKHAAPPIDVERAREAHATSIELQSHAAKLDPKHQRRARRLRRLRRTMRVLLLLLLIAAGLAVWRYVPLAEWWDRVQDAGRGTAESYASSPGRSPAR